MTIEAIPNPYAKPPRKTRMKIINKTHWRTDHLRAFAQRVAQEELSAEKRAKLVITFSYVRGHHTSSGFCRWIGGNEITVRLASSDPSKTDFAKVISHEMAHARGMTHAQMRNNARYRRIGNYREIYAWAEALPLEVKPKKVKKPVDLQAIRYQKTQASIKRWQTKLKRAQTALKKLRSQERYYERALERKAALNAYPASAILKLEVTDETNGS
jgi:hypothetical protein